MGSKIRFILDENTPVLFEKVIKNQFSKPIDYYGTLEEAISVLKSQGYGIVEIPPIVNKGQVSYITARVDSDENLILNLITYGWKKPVGEEARPFIIEGNSVWRQGDTIYNTDYIVNKVRGWVCIEEGIPGIWEEFGHIGYIPTTSSGESGSSSGSVAVSSNLVCYENELPSAGKSKLGKLILFAKDNLSDYDVYYCNRVIDEEGIVSYHWDSLSQGDSNYLKSVEFIRSDKSNSVWILNKVKNYIVAEDSGFRDNIVKSCILVGRIPSDSKNNQKIKIGGNEYLLKYDEEQSIQENDFKEGSIVAIKFNPEISYSSQNYLYIENIPIDYYLRKFSDLSGRLAQNISELTTLLNSKVSELTTNLNSVNSRLSGNISSVDSTLSGRLDSLSQDLSNAQSSLNSSINSVQSDLSAFKVTINKSLSDKDSELSGKINSAKTELVEDISSVNSTLLGKINSTNESLLIEIKKVSDKLNDLIDNKVELKGASINGNLSVSGVTDSSELIFPTVSGSTPGAIWLKSV